MNNGIPDGDDPRKQRIAKEAADWVVKKNCGMTGAEQDALFDWLAEDQEHSECYMETLQAWRNLDLLVEWKPEHSLKPNPDLLDAPIRIRKTRRLAWYIGGIAATLAFLGIAFWGLRPQKAELLAEGGFAKTYERHALEDGSIVELNRGAQASVKYDSRSRVVTLATGQAHFTIAKDASRPFVVEARGVAIKALGTQFDVRIENDTIDVLVTEGRVLVQPKSAEAQTPLNQGQPEGALELAAGQRSSIDYLQESPAPEIETVSVREIEESLTWLERVLNFQSAPLGEIVAALNERNDRRILIQDNELEGRLLTVAIKPDNIDGFIEILEMTMDIDAYESDSNTVVLRSR